MRWLIILIGLVIGFLTSVQTAGAVSEFAESHRTIYKVLETGEALVTHQIELRNKISNVYADKYWLSLGFTDVEEVSVDDGSGRIVPVLTQTANQTTISFEFVNKVVLKDKANIFTVSYKTHDVVSKNGAVWEINIPRLEIQNELGKNTVVLSVPSNFGLPAFITPEPGTKTAFTPTRGVDNTYEFDLSAVANKSISAVFGTTQYMEFDLGYYLENINPVKTALEIAIPPAMNYQRIFIKEMTPPPVNVRRDADGNWMAKYVLDGNEKVRVKVKGVAKMSFIPENEPTAGEVLAEYIKPTQLWNSDNPKIRELGQQLRSPRSIYQYVVDHLTYDYTKLNGTNLRLGGAWLLDSEGGGVCTDYSDLFISLARAAGVPARELQGFAFTSNDRLRPVSLNRDVLHSWPAYYDSDKGTWINVDPTWEDTTGGIDYFNKLDLNHLVFVIHGVDPFGPQPAGAYKDEQKSTKDVLVWAVDPVTFPAPVVEVEVEGDELVIANRGQVAVEGELRVSSLTAGIIDYKTYVPTIPPLGQWKTKLPVMIKKWWAKEAVALKISFNGTTYERETEIRRASLLSAGIRLPQIAGLILAAAAAIAGGLWIRGRR